MDGDKNTEATGIHFQNSVIPMGRLWGGLGLCMFIVLGSIGLASGSLFNGILTGVIAVLGALVGLLFQPQPKLPQPTDYSHVAVKSVERLHDLGTNLAAVQQTMTDLAGEIADPITKIRLVTAQNILLKQNVLVERTVSDWDSVSPGVAAQVRAEMNVGNERFAELIKGEPVEG